MLSIMHQFSVLDLYSGSGGLSLGFSMARSPGFYFEIAVANDIDHNAIATYEKNHSNVNAILGDLTSEEVKREIAHAVEKTTNRKTVDLVIGGPPCKGFSSANRMTRDDSNPLNDLALHFAEMVRRMNPFAFVMENVPGMLSLRGGRILDAVKDDLRKQGYKNTKYCLLNAADYGVPQKRMRMFLMGSKSQMCIEPPKKTHGKLEDACSDPTLKPYTTAGDAIGNLPSIPEGMACAPETKIRNDLGRNGGRVKNHCATVSSDLVVRRFRHIPQGGNWRNIPEDLMRVGGKYKNLDNMHSMIYKRLDPKEPSVTVTNFRKAMLIHPLQNRLLSVREAARIQTFPDDYEFEGGLHSMQQQVSDAVPVKLAESVANTVLAHMKAQVRYAKVGLRQDAKLIYQISHALH